MKKTLIKISAIMLVICMAAAMLPPGKSRASSAPLNRGDSTCDGTVNTADAVNILRYCAGTVQLSLYSGLASDVNSDGEVSTVDAATLLRLIVMSSDMIAPMEVVGDLSSPVLYTDIEYTEIDYMMPGMVTLSEYTSDAIESPQNTVTFGQGYSVHLDEGRHYVFETQASDSDDVDTVLYLLDGAGNAFLSDDNSGDARYSRIEFYSWQSGTYKLLVTGKNAMSVGKCRLICSEHKFIDDDPVPAPTATPHPTPTSTPAPTAAPTEPGTEPTEPLPTTQPVGGITFRNETIPTGGKAIQYKRAYSMKGEITSHDSIVLVRAEIVDKQGNVEMTAERSINPSLELTSYTLTDGGNTSINAQLKCAELSIGTKTIRLFCTTDGNSEVMIFTESFYVGASDTLLNGNAFIGSAAMGESQRKNVLAFINSLDEESLICRVTMEAFAYLGTPYGTGQGEVDCSLLVQRAYAQVGISLPRTSSEQGRYCYELNGEIPKADVLTGDLAFFRSVGCHCGRYREIHHVALMVGPVDGVWYYIEASSGRRKVVLRKEWGNNTSGWAIEFYGRPTE